MHPSILKNQKINKAMKLFQEETLSKFGIRISPNIS